VGDSERSYLYKMTKKRLLLLAILAILVLASCGPYRPRATAEITATPLPSIVLPPTATLVPTLSRKPTVTLTPTCTATPIIHTVRKGEILGQIALDYNVSIEAIMIANGLKNAHLLSIGQKLLIPNESMLAEMARGGLDIAIFTPTPAFPTPTLRPHSIAWESAEERVGTQVSAEGLIVRTRKAGGDICLYFHNPPEGHLGVRIPAEQLPYFASRPEIYYLDHWIMVSGVVERGSNGPEITVRKRSQISILD